MTKSHQVNAFQQRQKNRNDGNNKIDYYGCREGYSYAIFLSEFFNIIHPHERKVKSNSEKI